LVGRGHQDPAQVGHGDQRESGEVEPVGIAVRRCIQVGAGAGDHVDPADVELGAGRVVVARRFAAEVVSDLGSRQPGIGRHPVVDDVAEVDKCPCHDRV
jgi:hypothetical protein